jgi:peptidoglycan/xylan/chitin deacetylase (PgdA/CDA1 family)
MKKRALSLSLIFALTLALLTPVKIDAATVFEPLHTADDWAHGHINSANAKGFIPPALQNHYRQNITRAEFITLAMSWLTYQTGKTGEQLVDQFAAAENKTRTFTDTDDPVILAAAKLGITAGVGGGRFGVNDTFNRQQAAVMLTKVFAVFGTEAEVLPDFGFTDIDTADGWARDAINFVGHRNVMSGKGEGRFAPHDTFSRQESIAVFNQINPQINPAPLLNRKIPVLMYHCISDAVWGQPGLFVSPAEFDAQLYFLRDNGYTTVTFEDFPLPASIQKPVIITLDDGYRDNYTELFPLLKKHTVRVSVFLITDRIDSNFRYLTEGMILEMDASGLVSFQSHSVNHSRLTEITPAEAEEELLRSKEYIQTLLGKAPVAFAYPHGAYDEKTASIAARHYDYLLTTRFGAWSEQSDPLEIRRINILPGTAAEDFAKLLGEREATPAQS